ncbi:radical SAM protein [Streptomyces smyrnaeus]|uniref:radical SAM protein n=1 Tax=Streptomyces smyrnaeus TaxID=1387713 RepID=UPI0033A0A350
MRIATGDEGAWLVSDGSYTRLPPWAVTPAGTLRRPVRGVLNMLERQNKPPVRAYHLTVLTTTNCNLGCAYCFQNTGAAKADSFKPPRIDAKTLNAEAARDIARFTQRQMRAAGLKDLDLLVFGGEPLLVPHMVFTLLKALEPVGLQRARMISNGVRLNSALARQLAASGLREVQITFDGRQAEHDAVRRDHRGRGTYRTIIENIVAAQEATDILFSIRINVTADNEHGIDALVEDLGQQLDAGRCTLHLALVDETAAGFTAATDHKRLAERFAAWHIAALEQGFEVTPPTPQARCLYCDKRRGMEGAVINADGTLYSCWDSAGQKGYDVGTATEGYYSDRRVEDRWVRCGYQDHREPQPEAEKAIDRATVAVLEWKRSRGAP